MVIINMNLKFEDIMTVFQVSVQISSFNFQVLSIWPASWNKFLDEIVTIKQLKSEGMPSD